MAEKLVIDASAMVDYLVGSPAAAGVVVRISGGDIAVTAQAPFRRHLLPPLLKGAWARHHNVRLVDALYIELGSQLGATIITTDSGMSAASPNVELVG